MILDLQSTPVFDRNYRSDAKIVINRGGTRSSKSYSLAQLAVLFLVTGYVKPGVRIASGVWSVVRKTLPALKASVLRDFDEILHEKGLYNRLKINKSELTYTYKNRMVEFFSVDNQQKVRSRKRDVLNVSEANEILYDDYRQLLFRTEHRIYLDFNPSDINTWINIELEQKRMPKYGDVEVIQSSYKDNSFLSDDRIREIEMLSDTDPEYWQIFGLGEYGIITGLVFPEMQIVGSIPKHATLLGDGLDFGFTVDPTASYDLWVWQNNLYFDERIYATRLTMPDISATWLSQDKDKNQKCVADSANPTGIEELFNLGWNVHGAEKGPGSVNAGIDILKRYNLHATYNSQGIINEQKLYKWQTDKNGVTLNKPIDKFNHAWDGLRYIAMDTLTERPNILVA